MQKTTLYGKAHTQNSSRSESHPKNCPNCHKLQAQLTDLTRLLSQSQAAIEGIGTGSEQQLIKQVQGELLDLREQYATLKKRVKQVQKENDDLFTQNTLLEKQISTLRIQLKELDAPQKPTPKTVTVSLGVGTGPLQDGNVEERAGHKHKEVQKFVYQQKIRQLQSVNREQGQQIARLKQYLRKRNKQQVERHKLLQLFS